MVAAMMHLRELLTRYPAGAMTSGYRQHVSCPVHVAAVGLILHRFQHLMLVQAASFRSSS